MAQSAPDAVLQAAINRVVGDVHEKQRAAEEQADFIPSARFTGPRPGFYFTKGGKGLGYYADALQEGATEAQKPVIKQEVLDPEELLREAEEQAGDDGGEQVLLDARGLKRLILSFERKYKENMELRMKHTENPEKFMTSELDLDEEVRRLQAIAGSPELYPELIRLGGLPHILALLSHDNSDIAASAIQLLRELTDADAIEDSEEEARQLVAAMVENSALESLVQRLASFNESNDDEAEAVTNTLAIFENIVELSPMVAEELASRTKVLNWMLKRLKPREFDVNKGAVGESLALLLQSSQANAQKAADLNGIDAILQAVAPYKSKLPKSEDETEYIENLFNALCSTLMTERNRTLFVEAEGLELMVLILKQRQQVRFGALKAVDFACTRCPQACERFVDVLGLKILFSIFMGKSKVKRKKGEEGNEAEEEERCVSIISSLLANLARGSRRDRVCAKFVENEFEKCDHIMELYTRYDARVRAEEERLAHMDEEDMEDMDEDYILASRLEAGLFTLQQSAIIMANLWYYNDVHLRKRILLLLHQQGLTLEGVRRKLKEFHDSIGEEGGEEDAERQRAKIMNLMMGLGYEELKEESPQPSLPEASANGAADMGLGNKNIKEAPPQPPPEAPVNGAADLEEDPFQLDGLEERAPPLPEEPPPIPSSSTAVKEAESRNEVDKSSGDNKHAEDGGSEPKREKLNEQHRKERDRKERKKDKHREKDRDRDREKDRDRDRSSRRDRHRDKHDSHDHDDRGDRKRERHR